MKKLSQYHIMGVSMIALTFFLNITNANAATCSAMPSCESMRYNKTSCSSGEETLKCPFDTSRMKCIQDCSQFQLTNCSEAKGVYQTCGSTCRYVYCNSGYTLDSSFNCVVSPMPYLLRDIMLPSPTYSSSQTYLAVNMNGAQENGTYITLAPVGYAATEDDAIAICAKLRYYLSQSGLWRLPLYKEIVDGRENVVAARERLGLPGSFQTIMNYYHNSGYTAAVETSEAASKGYYVGTVTKDFFFRSSVKQNPTVNIVAPVYCVFDYVDGE